MWEIKQFIDLKWFEEIKTIAQYFVEQKALPKWIINAWQLVMLMQAWKDLWLSITQSMAGLVMINWVITVYGNVWALLMKRAWYDWEVIESNSKHCKIKIFKWDKIDEVEYDMTEAQFAWINWSAVWTKYPQEMIYRKCIARARKRICPEVLDWYSIYEDYQEMDKPIIPIDDVIDWFGKVEADKEINEERTEIIQEQQAILSDKENWDE